jgi:hypothetical protein
MGRFCNWSMDGVPPPDDDPPPLLPAPPLATLLPPPVLEGGRAADDPPEVEGVAGLELLDDPEDDGREDEEDDEPGGLGAPAGGLGKALPTAAAALAGVPSLRLELADVGAGGTRDIAILNFGQFGRSSPLGGWRAQGRPFAR